MATLELPDITRQEIGRAVKRGWDHVNAYSFDTQKGKSKHLAIRSSPFTIHRRDAEIKTAGKNRYSIFICQLQLLYVIFVKVRLLITLQISFAKSLDSLGTNTVDKKSPALKPKKDKMVVSSQSSIAGATLFCNLNGKDIENLVGAANVRLNTAKKFTGDFRLNIIGNITKVTGELNKEDIESDILKLVQSNQGLSIGMEPVYNLKSKGSWNSRFYGSVNYKVNVFKDIVKAVGDTANVTLDQGRIVAGFEAEGIEFDAGNFLYIGGEIGLSVFNKTSYYQVFAENKKVLIGTEITLGIPLFNKLKLLLKHTWAVGRKSTISTGIILTGVLN